MNTYSDILTTPNQNTSPATGLGVVCKRTNNIVDVIANQQLISCRLAGRFSAPEQPHAQSGGKHDSRQETPLAVGDWVRFERIEPGAGLVIERLPRRNLLSRRSAVPMPTAHAHEQVIAANLDQAVVVFSAAQPTPKWGLLDRYLVACEAAAIPALVCITKLDLALDRSGQLENRLAQEIEVYRQAGYGVILTSAASGLGVEQIRLALQGKLSVLLGKSGVGKTSLLNALQPGLGLRVNQVSQATGKGKHTTTCQEMFPLDGGGAIIDTPGVREFGLWGVEGADLAEYFPEMRPLLGRCRFGLDCRHDSEPGCAIRQAVLEGRISPLRYRSYMRLMEEA